MRRPVRSQKPPGTLRSSQKQPEQEATRNSQDQPPTARSKQEQPKAPRSDQEQPEAAKSRYESPMSLWSGDVILVRVFVQGTALRRLGLCARKAGVSGVLGFSFACGRRPHAKLNRRMERTVRRWPLKRVLEW